VDGIAIATWWLYPSVAKRKLKRHAGKYHRNLGSWLRYDVRGNVGGSLVFSIMGGLDYRSPAEPSASPSNPDDGTHGKVAGNQSSNFGGLAVEGAR